MIAAFRRGCRCRPRTARLSGPDRERSRTCHAHAAPPLGERERCVRPSPPAGSLERPRVRVHTGEAANSPSIDGRSCSLSARIACRNSTARCPAPFLGTPTPSSRAPGSRLMAITSRPPETTSTLASCLARTTGLRCGRMTILVRAARVVSAARMTARRGSRGWIQRVIGRSLSGIGTRCGPSTIQRGSASGPSGLAGGVRCATARGPAEACREGTTQGQARPPRPGEVEQRARG